MRKKKSYMNQHNILKEGFFNALASVFAPNSNASKQREYNKLKKSLGKDKAKFSKTKKGQNRKGKD